MNNNGNYRRSYAVPRGCNDCGNVRVTTGCNDCNNVRVTTGRNECGNVRVTTDCNDCGDTSDTLRGKAIAMAYVPWQQFGCTYEPMQGLHAGTIFPELDKPFYGRRGMR